MVRFASRVLCAGVLAAMPSQAQVAYGPLAQGADSISEMSGVHAEICRDHLLDSARLKMQMPPGYRLATVAELAKGEAQLGQLVARTPSLASQALGSLCFMLAADFIVDGARAHGRSALPMAFWWARIVPSESPTADPRMQGAVDWVQLASWYSLERSDQRLILRTDPMAQFVDLAVVESAPGQWRMHLSVPEGTIDAEVRVRGPGIRRDAPQPGFMTVLSSGDNANAFTVFTYFGHHHREASGSWRASGRSVFADSLRIPGEASAFGILFQEGWQARAALYRR